MIDTSFEVMAYNNFYKQGIDAYNSGNLELAKEKLLQASSIAHKISTKSDSAKIREGYYKIAKKTIEFVNDLCNKNILQKQPDENSDDDSDDDNKQFDCVSQEDKKLFKDVAGLNDVKQNIKCKVIQPILNPELAQKYKIKAGGRILLYGPPGTGKTLIAKAIAGEVDASFYAVNCQDLIGKYLGESGKRLKRLFDEAQKNERAIIFFDEIDAFASKRNGCDGADGEISRFVSTFLTLIDGFKKSKTNKMLLLVAATNRPWNIDSAMLRGGRFDTQIFVGPPDLEAVEYIVNKELSGVPIENDVSLKLLANRLIGFGGGDIVSICDKLKERAYSRAILTKNIEKINNLDINAVVANQKNVITKDLLQMFNDYKNNKF